MDWSYNQVGIESPVINLLRRILDASDGICDYAVKPPARDYVLCAKEALDTPADVKDLSHVYRIIIDMPGVEKDDITLEVIAGSVNVLIIRGTRKKEQEEEGVKFLVRERPVGLFVSKIMLPENAWNIIKAMYASTVNGVVTVTVKKKQPTPQPPPPQPTPPQPTPQPTKPKTNEGKMPTRDVSPGKESAYPHPDDLNPVSVPTPLPLIAPAAIVDVFQNALLNLIQHRRLEQLRQKEDWLDEMKGICAPTFHGKPDPIVAHKWIDDIEFLYEAVSVPNEKRVSIAVEFLRGSAKQWYEEKVEVGEAKDVVLDWSTFKLSFYKRYVPHSFLEQKDREFYNLKQGVMTVLQYHQEFLKLGRYIQMDMRDEGSKIKCFQTGLNDCIKSHFGSRKFESLLDVYNEAMQVESLLQQQN